MAGALAWVIAAGFWAARGFELLPVADAQSTMVSAWWIGLQANAVGAALVASSRAGRSAAVLGWGATVAFVVALFLQTTASAVAVANTHASQAADTAWVWMRAAVWFGSTLLTMVLGRIGAAGYRWARALAPAAVVIVPIAAAAEQVAWVSLTSDSARYGVSVASRLVIPLLIGALAVAAWRGASGMSPERRRPSLVDAVTAFAVLVAIRCALAFASGLVVSSTHPSGTLQAVCDDDVLGLATIACVVRICLAPTKLRSRWSMAAVGLTVVGCVVALASTDPAMDLPFRFGPAALGIVAIRTPTAAPATTAALVTQLCGFGAFAACTLAIAKMAAAFGVDGAVRGAGKTVGAFLVAAAATIPASSPPSPLIVAVGVAASAAGVVLLLRSCTALSSALQREAEAATSPKQAELSAQDGESNPYAPPAGERARERGGLGTPKLAAWRASVRDAVPWVLGPPLVAGAMTSGLVWIAIVAGDPANTADGRRESLYRAAAVFGAPLMTARSLARAIAFAGVIAMTASPGGRTGRELPGNLRAAARLSAALALAVCAAAAVIAMVYGLAASADIGPWSMHADHVAYGVVAFYGARLLAAGDRVGAALVMRFVALGFGLLTLACPLMLAAGKPFVDVSVLDSYATGILAMFAIGGALAMRDMLHDPE
jgi:hypothetical protein